MFGPLMGHRVEGEGGAPVGSRRPAQPQVNPARRESVEHPELLRDLERGVMRQHDTGAADTDAAGPGGDRRDQDLRRGPEDGRMAVMLGHPESGIAQFLA